MAWKHGIGSRIWTAERQDLDSHKPTYETLIDVSLVLMMVALKSPVLTGICWKTNWLRSSTRTVLKNHRKRRWCWGIQGNDGVQNHVETLKGAFLGAWTRTKSMLMEYWKTREVKTATFSNRYHDSNTQPYPTEQPTHQKMAIWASCGPEAGPLWSRYGFVRGPCGIGDAFQPSLGEVKSVKISRIFFPPQKKRCSLQFGFKTSYLDISYEISLRYRCLHQST